MKIKPSLKEFLDAKVNEFNRTEFIEADPISVPHRFKKKQDIEVAGLMAAVFAWGQRATIINKANDFLQRMDDAPYDFLLHHKPIELKRFESFKHRTFNSTDALYFIDFLKHFYSNHDSLEEAFPVSKKDEHVGHGLINFHNRFFSLDNFPSRTRKHIPTPERNSACKRVNMFLRWMVRRDNKGVDFGIWKNISPSQLICPFDLHVDRIARQLKLIERKQADWQTALELTNVLRKLDANDPVKYDFALFGLGAIDKF